MKRQGTVGGRDIFFPDIFAQFAIKVGLSSSKKGTRARSSSSLRNSIHRINENMFPLISSGREALCVSFDYFNIYIYIYPREDVS